MIISRAELVSLTAVPTSLIADDTAFVITDTAFEVDCSEAFSFPRRIPGLRRDSYCMAMLDKASILSLTTTPAEIVSAFDM